MRGEKPARLEMLRNAGGIFYPPDLKPGILHPNHDVKDALKVQLPVAPLPVWIA